MSTPNQIVEFVNAGMAAQSAVDDEIAKVDVAKLKAKVASAVAPGYIRRQLHTMDEIILSMRDAARTNNISLSAEGRELLASDVESHAKRVIQLAYEIREAR